ncbi:MAG: TetR/AcrR family transcriptional regulator [Clostridia bacterium]|nr:TetR/AcrR family transcriptional regulator [Clostridia bacterium]
MKNNRNTKSRIVDAAWKLFYENGYENTTIEQIIFESSTSRGSFYHYFSGKDALLGSMAYLFDEKYESLQKELDPEADALETLFYLNRALFSFIEQRVDIDLLTRLYATQLTQIGEKQFLDRSRVYYRLLRAIVTRGQERGEIKKDRSVSEIVRLYAMCERGMLYEWCLYRGEYSLAEYAAKNMPLLLSGLRTEPQKTP